MTRASVIDQLLLLYVMLGNVVSAWFIRLLFIAGIWWMQLAFSLIYAARSIAQSSRLNLDEAFQI